MNDKLVSTRMLRREEFRALLVKILCRRVNFNDDVECDQSCDQSCDQPCDWCQKAAVAIIEAIDETCAKTGKDLPDDQT